MIMKIFEELKFLTMLFFYSLGNTLTMNYKVLPACFDSRTDPFKKLPQELISHIFRYLDNDSLLEIHVTSKRFRNICLNDIVLRSRLKSRLAEIREERLQKILNPSFGRIIVRNCDSTLPTVNPNVQRTEKSVLVQTSTSKWYDLASRKFRKSRHLSDNKKVIGRSIRI